jgi:hypothetical protein
LAIEPLFRNSEGKFGPARPPDAQANNAQASAHLEPLLFFIVFHPDFEPL